MNLVNIGGIFLLAVLVLSVADCIQQADTVSCAAVIDGDTIRLDTGETVRLIGIDAPELSQPGGEMSRQYLYAVP
jgi:endonuclease YncB( thermonuclease family)